jgi:tetratricopeptide (TPR) repeat protein
MFETRKRKLNGISEESIKLKIHKREESKDSVFSNELKTSLNKMHNITERKQYLSAKFQDIFDSNNKKDENILLKYVIIKNIAYENAFYKLCGEINKKLGDTHEAIKMFQMALTHEARDDVFGYSKETNKEIMEITYQYSSIIYENLLKPTLFLSNYNQISYLKLGLFKDSCKQYHIVNFNSLLMINELSKSDVIEHKNYIISVMDFIFEHFKIIAEEVNETRDSNTPLFYLDPFVEYLEENIESVDYVSLHDKIIWINSYLKKPHVICWYKYYLNHIVSEQLFRHHTIVLSFLEYYVSNRSSIEFTQLLLNFLEYFKKYSNTKNLAMITLFKRTIEFVANATKLLTTTKSLEKNCVAYGFYCRLRLFQNDSSSYTISSKMFEEILKNLELAYTYNDNDAKALYGLTYERYSTGSPIFRIKAANNLIEYIVNRMYNTQDKYYSTTISLKNTLTQPQEHISLHFTLFSKQFRDTILTLKLITKHRNKLFHTTPQQIIKRMAFCPLVSNKIQDFILGSYKSSLHDAFSFCDRVANEFPHKEIFNSFLNFNDYLNFAIKQLTLSDKPKEILEDPNQHENKINN